MSDFEWLPTSAADIRTGTLESLEEKANLQNALCIMAFFLGMEQGRLHFATKVIEVTLSLAERRAAALRGCIGGPSAEDDADHYRWALNRIEGV